MKMTNWLVACLPFLTAATAHTTPTEAREQQWKTIAVDGQHSSKAIFLSWDGKVTVFTVSCDRHSKEIVIRYSIPKNVSFDPARPLAIGEVDFRTTKTGQNLEGRSQLTSPLKSQLSARAELEIQAPNEMGEPWYVGIGEPLRRVALACH